MTAATRFDPGPHDPGSRRLPDEPYFMLLARDPAAAVLVEIWAHVRSGNLVLAQAALGALDSPVSGFDAQADADAQIRSAMAVANQMTGWRLARAARGLPPFDRAAAPRRDDPFNGQCAVEDVRRKYPGEFGP